MAFAQTVVEDFGVPATRQTVAYIGYDEKNLYAVSGRS